MSRPHRCLLVAVLVASASCLAPAHHASCGSSYLIRTNTTVVSNPNWCGGYGCYDHQGGPPVSEDVAAVFWALGTGDPTIGEGDDSGAMTQDEWFFQLRPPGTFENGVYYYGVMFLTSWAADEDIDGCVTGAGPPGDNCTAILFSDQFDAAGYFAVLSDRSDAVGHFDFSQPEAAPIALARTPKPNVVGTARLDPFTIALTVAPPVVPADGLYLDPSGCESEVVVGYKIYAQATSPGHPAPIDRRRDDGDPMTGWESVPTDWAPSGQPVPLDSHANLELSCGSAPLYLATTLVFDSGFELAHVSEHTGAILCDPFCIDLDADGWCGFAEVPEIPLDCDDSNPSIHPYAAEINDGLDNQCPGYPGRGTIDEISGASGFFSAGNPNEFSWPGQEGATSYEIARSGRSDFSEDCASIVTEQGMLELSEDPVSGGIVFVLIRPLTPHLGSWGATSTGTERLFSCP